MNRRKTTPIKDISKTVVAALMASSIKQEFLYPVTEVNKETNKGESNFDSKSILLSMALSRVSRLEDPSEMEVTQSLSTLTDTPTLLKIRKQPTKVIAVNTDQTLA